MEVRDGDDSLLRREGADAVAVCRAGAKMMGQVTELIMWAYTMYESMQWAIASCSETPLSFAFFARLFLQFLPEQHPSSLHGLHPFRGTKESSDVVGLIFSFVECLSSRWNHRLFIHDFLPSFFLHTVGFWGEQFFESVEAMLPAWGELTSRCTLVAQGRHGAAVCCGEGKCTT